MKVVEFFQLPKIGDFDQWHMTVEDDGRKVTKSITVTAFQKRMDSKGSAFFRVLMKAIIEVERDFAFLNYGDQWPAHVGKRGCPLHMDLMRQCVSHLEAADAHQ